MSDPLRHHHVQPKKSGKENEELDDEAENPTNVDPGITESSNDGNSFLMQSALSKGLYQ